MTATEEHVELLSGIGLFSGLDESVLDKIARLAREVDHDEGHSVVREGAGAHAMHLIVDGDAVVTIGDREVARLGPGDSFGEVALFDRGSRSATVTAAGPLKVLAIDGSGFLQLVKSDGELAARLLSHMAGFLRGLDGELAECRLGRTATPG
ncbi:MAG: cyclic nucleotide-binding domain-containing protein [Acidimicrobiia bacterium]|jgi:CRP-like cAMP-binding protein